MSRDTQLKKGVDLPSVIALGLGTAVGVSIFSVIAPAAAVAGPAMLLSVPLAALPMFVIAVTYAFMGSAAPTSGASYEWARRFLSPAAGFAIAWLRIAGTVGAMLILSLVLVRYLSIAIPMPVKPAMFVIFVIVFGLNMFGVGVAARIQTVLIAALVVFFIVFAGWGAQEAEPAAFTPFFPEGWSGALAAVPLLVGLFFGIEAATEVGDEVRDGRKTIPLGIAGAIVSAVVLYLLVAGVTLGVLGVDRLAASETPILDAAAAFMGEDLARPLVIAAAVAAIGTSLNALCMVFSRYLFAMGRSGVFPSVIATVNARFGTPHVALGLAFLCCSLALFLPMSLTALFLAVNVPTLLKFGGTCLSAVQLVKRRPDLYDGAHFKLGRRFTVVWAWLGLVAAIVVVALGVTTDWRPYLALAIWGAIGLIYYLLRGRRAASLASAGETRP